MRKVVSLALITLVACSSAISTWQPLAREPVRPELPAGADANSAHAYYAYGAMLLEREPAKAADAFHWASRLDPAWADPLYARRVAFLLSDKFVFSEYLKGTFRVTESPGVQSVDSLYRRALMMNPFLQPKHYAMAIRSLIHWSVERELRTSGSAGAIDQGALDYLLNVNMNAAGPETRAWIAHSEGRFSSALESYRTAVQRNEDAVGLRADLARVLFFLGRYAEAQAEMARAVESMREADRDELVVVYESKALFEHSIGMILEQRGDTAGARQAYARALQEDLAYYPAHMRLGELALVLGDTATALNELRLAVDIQDQDPAVRYRYGRGLVEAGRFAEAELELKQTIALEPLFAAPYRLLAEAVDRQGRPGDAVQHYRDYIAHASRDAPGLAEAKRRLTEIAAAGSGAAEARP